MEKVWVLSTPDGVLTVSRSRETCECVRDKLFDKLRLKRTTDLPLENGVFTFGDDENGIVHTFTLTEHDLND